MIRYTIAFENIGIGADLSLKSTFAALKFLISGIKDGKTPRIRIYRWGENDK
jgi:hypothetical protein